MKSRDPKSPGSGNPRSRKRTDDPARLLEDAGKHRVWVDPPADHTEAAASLPSSGQASMAPKPDAAASMVNWAAPDVRGTAPATVAGQPRTATHAFDAGEVTLMITPPQGNASWRIQGTVWLREPVTVPFRVFWVQGEHVVHALEATEGELFEMEEVVGAGWQIEIHLPDGSVLCVAEPQS